MQPKQTELVATDSWPKLGLEYRRRRQNWLSPIEHSTASELQNLSIDISELHKIRGSTGFEAMEV